MQAGLPNIPVVSHAKRVIATLREHGHQAYLAGGCVRDALLGRTPIDYDVATSATPDQVQALFKKTSPVGKQFGVVLSRAMSRALPSRSQPFAATETTPTDDAPTT